VPIGYTLLKKHISAYKKNLLKDPEKHIK